MNRKPGNINKNKYRKPLRVFEKSGVVKPAMSYYVSLENVVNSDNQDIKAMIDRGRYFSIFAPRQSGKTTFIEAIREDLHKDKTYVIIIMSFQKYKELDKSSFYQAVETDLYEQLINRLNDVDCEKIETVSNFLEHHHLTDHISFSRLFEELNRVIQFKKIIIFIDEFDGIPLHELENFLAVLRDWYQKYKGVKQKALYSVGLIGIRNITKLIVGGVSPFNIADQVEMPPFSLRNVHDLYAQYTAETNQPFTTAAVKRVYEETAGQPWLVNRLGTILTADIKPETVTPIDEKDVESAVRLLLQEKNAHFDNLYEKAKLYKETFVEIVFDNIEYSSYDEEQSWLEQYGLIKESGGKAVVSNNIYKAIHLKAFFKEVQAAREIKIQGYMLQGERLDMERILVDFSRYIAQIGVRAFYQQDKPYEKTGQFLLTAWLYQFVKGGEGDLRYEVHTGLGRMDVLLTYKGKKYIIETKVNRCDEINVIVEEGVMQVSRQYLASEGEAEGYLVIFDTRTHVGNVCKPGYHRDSEHRVTSFIIGIGKTGAGNQ